LINQNISKNDFYESRGIILTGYLDKKGKSGMWTPRFFVLYSAKIGSNYGGESNQPRLEIYLKSTASYWGNLPLSHKRTIHANDILSVVVDSSPSKLGKEFTIVVQSKKSVVVEEERTSTTENSLPNNNKLDMVVKDGPNEGSVNILQLKAETAEIRMDWTDCIKSLLTLDPKSF
jgi:hypothetical protein